MSANAVPWTITLAADVSRELRRRVPARSRSRFISDALRTVLLEKRQNQLTSQFLDVIGKIEALRNLDEEMSAWDAATADGLGSPDSAKVSRVARKRS